MSLFKGKRNDTSATGNSIEGGFVFNQQFTGEVFLTPLAFNPTGEEIKAFKNLPDSVNVEDPNYIMEKIVDRETEEKRTVRRIILLTKFNPNTQLPKGTADKPAVKYGENYFYNLPASQISSHIVHSRNEEKGDKILVIDAKMNSAWVNCDVDKAITLNDAYKVARKGGDEDEIEDAKNAMTKFVRKAVKDAAAVTGDVSYGASAIDLVSARMCRDGEEPIAKLLFDMTPLSSVRYMTKADIKTLTKTDPKTCERRQKEYEEFDMSHTEEVFNMLLDGKFEEVNKLIFEDNKEAFESDGEQCKIGVFFGARLTDEGKVYQSSMSPYGKFIFGQHYTFKKPWKAVKPAVLKDFTAYGPTFINKEMAKRITDSQYGYNDEWQNSFAFQPYVLEQFTAPVTEEKVVVKADKSGNDLPF